MKEKMKKMKKKIMNIFNIFKRKDSTKFFFEKGSLNNEYDFFRFIIFVKSKKGYVNFLNFCEKNKLIENELILSKVKANSCPTFQEAKKVISTEEIKEILLLRVKALSEAKKREKGGEEKS